MGYFDWVDLKTPEWREFLRKTANDLHARVQELSKFQQEAETQAKYIEELEKQVSILQKTLDCVCENRCLRRRLHNGKKKNVCNDHNR